MGVVDVDKKANLKFPLIARLLAGFSAVLVFFLVLACATKPQYDPLSLSRRPTAEDALRVIGNRFAIVVGVSKYSDTGLPGLPTALDDATDLATQLEVAGFNVALVADEKRSDVPILATPDNNASVRNIISSVGRQMESQDLMLFYFSGHGANVANQDYVFLSNSDPKRPYETALSIVGILSLLDTLSVKKRVLIVDACRDPGFKASPFDAFSLEAARNWEGTAVLSATDSGQYARPPYPGETDVFTGEVIKHSIYTHFLLRGLRGEADEPNHTPGFLTLNELAGFLSRSMRRQAPEQVPQCVSKGLGGDIYLSEVLENTTVNHKGGLGPGTAVENKRMPACIDCFLPDTYDGIESFDGSLFRARGELEELVWSAAKAQENRPYLQFLDFMLQEYGTKFQVNRAWIAYRRNRTSRTLVFAADRSLWDTAGWDREPGWFMRLMGENSNKVGEYHGVKYTAVRISDEYKVVNQAYTKGSYELDQEDYLYCELGGYCVVVPRLNDLQELVDLFQQTRGRPMNVSPALGEQLAFVDDRSAFWHCALVNEEESLALSHLLQLEQTGHVQRLSAWYDMRRNAQGQDRVDWRVVLTLETEDQAIAGSEALTRLSKKWGENGGMNMGGRVTVERPSTRRVGISGVLTEPEIAILEDLIRTGQFTFKWEF
jgi:Caspase domain